MTYKKRILLISPNGYALDMKNTFEKLGYFVDLRNDKPNDGFICKAAVRTNLKIYESVLLRYYEELLREVVNNKYDYVLVIRGEFFLSNALKKFRIAIPHAKFILYMWDSVGNYPRIQTRWEQFDRVYTFDPCDAEKFGLAFRPLFFTETFSRANLASLNEEYAISFIGTAHGDRPSILASVDTQCRKINAKTFMYLYQPFKAVFYINKISNRSYRSLNSRDIHYNFLPHEKVAEMLSHSIATLDIEHPSQTGLTMRTIEAIGLGIKIITTNRDIANYDFYDPANVSIVDRDNVIIDWQFLAQPMKNATAEIYRKYSIQGWAEEILSIDLGENL